MRSRSGVSTGPGQSGHAHALPRELDAQLLAHREHGALRRGVGDLRRRRADERDERRDVDHGAAAALEQIGDAVLAAEEDAAVFTAWTRSHASRSVSRIESSSAGEMPALL